MRALIAALDDKNLHRRRRAARALEGMGPKASSAVPALTSALQDPLLRLAAICALVRIEPTDVQRHIPVLIVGLSDPDRDVALLSAEALANLATPEAVPGLIQALDDDRIHAIAVEGLRRMGPRAAPAVPALVKTLQDQRDQDRSAAAHALGEIGTAAGEAIPALKVLMRDEDSGVRDAAALALRKIDKP
jgi:HEAT repeat protein